MLVMLEGWLESRVPSPGIPVPDSPGNLTNFHSPFPGEFWLYSPGKRGIKIMHILMKIWAFLKEILEKKYFLLQIIFIVVV